MNSFRDVGAALIRSFQSNRQRRLEPFATPAGGCAACHQCP